MAPAPAAAAPADPAPQTAQPAATPAPPARPLTAEAFCGQLTRLSSECEAFARFRASNAECVAQTRQILEPPPKDAQVLALLSCVVQNDGCESTLKCINASVEDPSAGGSQLRACTRGPSDPVLAPVGIPRAEWARRKGAGLTTYRAAASSKASPIEMCGATAENRWLATLACDDGSHPLADAPAAERSRAGSVGPGGRCGSIIDHYAVACPEAKYDVFIDAYICPLPQ